ncbi:hypothetical protein CLV77_2794 [Brevirhabdus pacifica]|nr:hypothetical protein CLV77_2794 [Brevirhabdus pacifica]
MDSATAVSDAATMSGPGGEHVQLGAINPETGSAEVGEVSPEAEPPSSQSRALHAAPERNSTRRAKPDYPSPQTILEAAREIFGTEVTKMTAPGGRKRASIRIHMADGPRETMIATYRPASRRRETELRVLRHLGDEGANVPQVLGVHGDILFQSDAGSRRLTSELLRARNDDLDDLVSRTYESLWEIKSAARRSGLLAQTPPVATGVEWLRDFTQTPREISNRLGIRAPRLKLAPLAQSLVTLPVDFIKWDARPGNASVQDDGSILWFDWEHAGRRRGVEDFAFLLGDEFWTLSPTRSLYLFARSCPQDPDPLMPLLRRFSTLQMVQRVGLIESQQRRHGWNREDRARRYDRIGTAPELLHRLREHGIEMALMDPLTEPLADWFDQATNAILTR